MDSKIILNVRSQRSYDSLMVQLDKLDYVWVTDRVPSNVDKWYIGGRETVIYISTLNYLTYGSTYDCKEKGEDYQVFKPKDNFEEIIQKRIKKD